MATVKENSANPNYIWLGCAKGCATCRLASLNKSSHLIALVESSGRLVLETLWIRIDVKRRPRTSRELCVVYQSNLLLKREYTTRIAGIEELINYLLLEFIWRQRPEFASQPLECKHRQQGQNNQSSELPSRQSPLGMSPTRCTSAIRVCSSTGTTYRL